MFLEKGFNWTSLALLVCCRPENVFCTIPVQPIFIFLSAALHIQEPLQDGGRQPTGC